MLHVTSAILLELLQYGYLALFVLLAMGIVGLPIPDETLLALSGVLVAKGKLMLVPTLLVAYCGGMCGISLSYVIGRTAGYYLIKKYGRWIGITEPRLQYAHNWFERFGKWTLFIGYFVPGVRHLTGYAAGATKLDYKYFAIFAYSGAVCWASLFFTLGYYFSTRWEEIVSNLDIYMLIPLIAAAILGLVFFLRYRKSVHI